MSAEPGQVMTAMPPARSARFWRGHLRPVIAALALVCVVSAALDASLASSLRQEGKVNDFLAAEVARLNAQASQAVQLRKQIESAQTRRVYEATWTTQRRWPAHLLHLLTVAAASGVRFDQIRDTQAGVDMIGIARTYDDVATSASALSDAPEVIRVDVIALEREKQAAALKFTLRVAIDPAWRPLERAAPSIWLGNKLEGDPP